MNEMLLELFFVLMYQTLKKVCLNRRLSNIYILVLKIAVE
jgi:hypothetical protein